MWFYRCRAARRKSLTAGDPLQLPDVKVFPARECVPGRQIRRATAVASAWRAARHYQWQRTCPVLLWQKGHARKKIQPGRELCTRFQRWMAPISRMTDEIRSYVICVTL